jgi:CHAT domain-containing protein/tetratricopeptide (TPR) repeat protein
MKKQIHILCAGLLVALFLLVVFPFPIFAAPLTQEEDPKAKADALSEEATSLFYQGDYQGAINRFEEALTIYREIGDRSSEGETLSNIGQTYDSLGQYEQALDFYQQALPVLQEVGDQDGEALVTYLIGYIYHIWQDFPQALEHYQQALTVAREIGDSSLESAILGNTGVVYDSLGQYQQALDHYQPMLALAQKNGDRAREGTALNNIGGAYRRLGQYSQALEYLQQALTIAEELNDRPGEGIALGNIGQVYESLGQYEQALEYDQQALAILREVGDPAGEATTLTNIGVVYQHLAQQTQALDYYQQALVILQEIGNHFDEGRTLSNIGAVYRSLGEYRQALEYYQQALVIQQEIGDQAGEESTLNNIGFVYHMMDQYSQALDYYQKALVISQEIGDRAGEGRLLNNIGFIYDVLEQYPQALSYYQQALPILREIGQRGLESVTLNNIGFVYEQQQQYEEAINYYEQSVEVIESIQGEINVEELKASFLAEQAGHYEILINLLWEAGRFEEAFNYTERARARSFLDQLAGGTIDFRSGANAGLLEREQAVRDEITVLRNQLITLREQPQTEWDTDAIAATQNGLVDREAEYAQLLTEIKVQSPEIASLVSINVVSLGDIQNLLDANTTLIEYFVTEDRTLAFILTKDSFETMTMNVNRDDLNQVIQDFRDFVSLDDSHPASLKQLHAWLIAPLKDKLNTPVLGFVPHGVLHYLPFSALTDGERYLSEDYSLFTLPSASTLRFIQEKRKSEAQTVLAVGNPDTELPDLQFAEQESQFVASLYGTQAWIGRQATESVIQEQSNQAGILHLAAHGEFNSANPLFSTIHLASDSKNDGRLEVHEIFGLDLTYATDLVVLSACETNVGAVSAGDEVVGLNRAFIYAGTPTVMASLWNVDDEATALLMEQFYTRLQEGMSKGEALQQAQDEVRAQYPHPYYWAAFVLTGDPGLTDQVAPALIPQTGNWMRQLGRLGGFLLGIGCIGIIGLLAGLAFWRWRRRV